MSRFNYSRRRIVRTGFSLALAGALPVAGFARAADDAPDVACRSVIKLPPRAHTTWAVADCGLYVVGVTARAFSCVHNTVDGSIT